jgi:hypothetical protein
MNKTVVPTRALAIFIIIVILVINFSYGKNIIHELINIRLEKIEVGRTSHEKVRPIPWPYRFGGSSLRDAGWEPGPSGDINCS